MSQPYRSSGQPAGPPRPAVPAPVRTAVKLMYAGAAVSTVTVIISLALIPAIETTLRKAKPSLTAAQASDVNTLITLAMVFGLAVITVWLWMARANGQGRNRARILSAVLVVLATLQLRGAFTRLAGHAGSGVAVLYYGGVVLFVAAWLAGGAALWLLWRPASDAFFKPPGSAPALHQAHMAELDRLRSSRARSPRQV